MEITGIFGSCPPDSSWAFVARISAWQRAKSSWVASVKFFTIWNRSAHCVAWGAPSAAALAYSPPRSRLTTKRSGCWRIQAAAVSASRRGEKIYYLMGLQIHEDRAEAIATSQCEIVYAQKED